MLLCKNFVICYFVGLFMDNVMLSFSLNKCYVTLFIGKFYYAIDVFSLLVTCYSCQKVRQALSSHFQVNCHSFTFVFTRDQLHAICSTFSLPKLVLKLSAMCFIVILYDFFILAKVNYYVFFM